MKFYNNSISDVFKSLSSNSSGLSDSDVLSKRKKFGLNELTKGKKLNVLLLFLSQFKSFIIYVLLFALAISFFTGEYVDAVVILIILLFNAIFGFIQEFRAEKSLEQLKKLASLNSVVFRNGKKVSLDSKFLVPGDIVFLEEGNKVPADCRIIECSSLQVSESILTGESMAVSKTANILKGELGLADRKNMLFSGTSIVAGSGRAIVTSIGMNTQIGKIATLVTDTQKEMTPLQKKLQSLGSKIVWLTLALCLLVFIGGVLREGIFNILLSGDFLGFFEASREWLLTAVSLAVAAVPEGLPAVVTISLAIGVKKMLKKNALIRRLPSVESLGETTVICSDKTGTLTKNEMTVRSVFIAGKNFELTGLGYDSHGSVICKDGSLSEKDKLVYVCGALCNNSSVDEGKITGDPTEASLLVSCEKVGLSLSRLENEYERIEEIPFSSIRKMMSVVVKKGNKKFVFSKGAPEILLNNCSKVLMNNKEVKLSSKLRKQIISKNESLAKDALRVLGFAYKSYTKGDKESDLVFLGLQGMIDPPHKEVKGAIAKCYGAGIRVIMITGDNVVTAGAIAKEIGIKGNAMLGAEFAKLSEKKQIDAIKKFSVFARVEPAHKMRIVDILQSLGEVVAMTGDGVNDAPAIKSADLGISMGISGTDVTKEASDMILQDDNFTSIVNAVEEGRSIYQNIKKFVNYLLSSNVAEVTVIFLAIMFGWPLPMTAIMILWLNLVTDGLPALALSVDPNPGNLMKDPPKKKNEPIMDKDMVINISIVAVWITLGVLFLFDWGLGYDFANVDLLPKAQTLAFTVLMTLEIVRLQTIRSEYGLKPFSNKWLVYAVLASFILQLVVIYSPINSYFGTVPLLWLDWVMILAVTAVVGFLNMLTKKIIDKITG
ncbi:calcium-translocating P-type ATPase, SERCA-type [Candidatus Woesearchaeota archaeon]|nr:calcium-translocating P-type ATPase, SERCA-type [Candidatus Woesearchaeota archaeon]MCF7901402.1 calcium-translocating P-type ATPase, SERCA-type [Candidatus Woesearchaeota archaeon]MCF8013724.1 calcium-translocating P-type ATPase, SERCA-type [Candidatus Woesearchaeota archaeon]